MTLNNAALTNTYTRNKITLNLVKVDASNMTTPLGKAQFTLKKLDPNGKGTYLTGTDAVELISEITGTDGTTSITDIYDGYYEISETAIPDGYILVDDGKFYIKVSNGVITLLTKDSETVVTSWQERTLTSEDKLQFNTTTKTFTVGNTPGAELPSTGGPGTRLFTILGGMLLAFAGAMLLRRRQAH